jgi:uncharacterized membrane protein
LHSLETFSAWLALTPLSQAIQTVEWIIPAVQTVHILCVAAVMSAMLMINLRLLGASAREQRFATVAARFLPFIWWPLPILLLTGATLVVAEPGRSLQNPVFVLKMGLLLAVIAVTLICQIPLGRNAEFWELSSGRRRAGRVIAALSLPLWIGIVFAGRWIAYIQAA